MSLRRFIRAFTASALLSASWSAHAGSWCADRCDRVVTDWNATALQVDPTASSRSLALMHLAMHDAANTVIGRYQRYALAAPQTGPDAADAAVAASAAAHDVLVALYPTAAATDIARVQLERTMFAAGAGQTIDAGVRIGKAAAAAVLARRANDGHDKPFTLVSASQFRSMTSSESVEAHTRGEADELRQDLWDRARTFAMVNMVMTDVQIASVDSKPAVALVDAIDAYANRYALPRQYPDGSFED